MECMTSMAIPNFSIPRCITATDKTVPSPWRQPYNLIIPVTTGRAQLQKIGSETSSPSALRTLACQNKRMPALSQVHACSRLLAPILEASRIYITVSVPRYRDIGPASASAFISQSSTDLSSEGFDNSTRYYCLPKTVSPNHVSK